MEDIGGGGGENGKMKREKIFALMKRGLLLFDYAS